MGGEADMINAIVNAGKTGWDIVKGSKATSSAKASWCSAVPDNMPFNDLYGWKTKSGSWNYITENPFGWELVNAKLVWTFQYNGITDKVKGAMFLTNFSVYCESISVFPMIDATVDATVAGQPFNAGTKQAPIAGIPLLVSASTGGSRSVSTTWKLTAYGDGRITSG